MKRFEKEFIDLVDRILSHNIKNSLLNEYINCINSMTSDFSVSYQISNCCEDNSFIIETPNKQFGYLIANCDPAEISSSFSQLFLKSVSILARILENISNNESGKKTPHKQDISVEFQKLKKSETLYRGMEKVSKIGGWEYDVKNNNAYWTPETYRIYGFDLRDFDTNIPIPFEDSLSCFAKPDKEKLLEAFLECIKSGKAYDLELKMTNKKGKQLWVKTGAKTIKRNGMVVKAQGYIIDITERKKAELELRESHIDIQLRHEIANIFLLKSDEKVYSEILKKILIIVQSNHGFLGYIDEHGDLVCPTITENLWSKSLVSDKSMTLPKNAWGGLWGDSLLKKKTLIKEMNLSTPQGHTPLTRAMTVPILLGRKLIGLIAVANKETEYNKRDQRRVESVAKYIAPLIKERLEKMSFERQRAIAIKGLEESEDLLRKISENYPNSFVAIIEKDQTIGFVSGQELLKRSYLDKSIVGKTFREIIGGKAKELEMCLNKTFQGTENELKFDMNNVFYHIRTVPLIYNDSVNRVLVVAENITQKVRLDTVLKIERDLGIKLTKVSTLYDAMCECLEHTLQIPGIDSGGIYKANYDTEYFELFVHKNVSPKFIKNVDRFSFKDQKSIPIFAVTPFYIDYEMLKIMPDKYFIKEGFLASAILPVHHKGHIVGCINLVSRTETEFPEYLYPFFENMISMLGTILVNLENQEIIRNSEERYRNFIMNASEGIFRIDFIEPVPINLSRKQLSERIVQNAVFVEVNEALAQMYGSSVEELTGKHVHQVIPDFDEKILKALDTKGYIISDLESLIYDIHDKPVNISESFRVIVDEKNMHRIWGMQRNITEQKFAAQKLSDSQHHLAEAQRIGNIGSFILDAKSRKFIWSDQMYEIFGFEDDGRVPDISLVRSIIHPEDLGVFDNAITMTENNELPVNVQYRILLPDKTLKWVVSRNEVILDENGKPFQFRGTVQDITERKQTELALEKRMLALTRPIDYSENILFEELFNVNDIQKLQDLFASATGVASLITYVDGTPITKPSNFCDLCENIIRKTDKGRENCYRSDAIIGRHPGRKPIVQPCLSGGLWDAGASITVGGTHIANWLIGQVRNDAQTEDEMLQYAREIGADADAFIKAFRKVPKMSNKQFQQVADALFVIAKQLSDTAYQNVQQARFISERKKAQIALQESESRLKSYVENAPDGIMVTDELGNYVDVNPAACEIIGYTRNELLKMNIQDVIAPEDTSLGLEHFENVKNTGSSSGDMQFIMKNGKKRYWTVDAVKLTNTRFLGFAKDITDRKRVEKQIKQSLDEKSVLLKEIHHRVKNNLQVMRSLISLQTRYEKSQVFCDSATELSNRILSMALVHEQLYQSNNMAEINFKSYIMTLCDEILASLFRKDINIRLDLEDIKLDIEKSVPLGLIINELVTNAVKHAFPDEKTGKIELLLSKENKKGVLSICDNGQGIPENVNLDKPKSLGLELVRILTRQLDGEIEFHRKGGTKVTISFPIN